MCGEVWKPVPGYEGLYEVSDQGRVRRIAATTNTWEGRILKQWKGRRGYHRVCLCKSNKKKTHSVHRLVLTAFRGEGGGLEVNHRDGDKGNNCIDNLEWVTRSENELHKARVLGMKQVPPVFNGEDNMQSILTEDQVIEIRQRHDSGDSAYRLSKEFPVSKTTILNIVNYRAWKHVA